MTDMQNLNTYTLCAKQPKGGRESMEIKTSLITITLLLSFFRGQIDYRRHGNGSRTVNILVHIGIYLMEGVFSEKTNCSPLMLMVISLEE